MFTQCPDCRKVYSLDSELNPEDKTRMYCSTCAKDFNVLELLTENPMGLLAAAKAEIIAKVDVRPKPKKKRKNRATLKANKEVDAVKNPVPPPASNLIPDVMVMPMLIPAVNAEEIVQHERMPWETEKLSFRETLETLIPFGMRRSAQSPVDQTYNQGNQQDNRDNDQTQGLGLKIGSKTNWQLASLVALLLLVGQLLYYSVDDFNQSLFYRPYLEKICHLVGCRLSYYRNINEFEVLQGSFKANSDKSITFKAVISNQASFKQKLPDVKLSLVDYEEHLFAQRLFKPGEYLVGKPSAIDIGSEESMEVQLLLAEPKTPIGGYYFDLTY